MIFWCSKDKEQLNRIERKLDIIMADQTQLEKDEAALTQAVSDESKALTAVAAVITQDSTTIMTLSAEIATLKVALPTVDLTSLEKAINSLQANNTTLAGLVPVPSAAPTA
jgi:ACT domain-containing protein